MRRLFDEILSKHNLTFEEIFTTKGLMKLDNFFINYLKNNNCVNLLNSLLEYRNGQIVDKQDISNILIECAIHLEHFISRFFSIELEVEQNQKNLLTFEYIAKFKEFYITRKAARLLNQENNLPHYIVITDWMNNRLIKYETFSEDFELKVAKLGCDLLQDIEKNKVEIDMLTAWCVHNLLNHKLYSKDKNSVLFNLPKLRNSNCLIQYERDINQPYKIELPLTGLSHRDGFDLTDNRMNQKEIMNQVHYCLYCHKNQNDFCSSGFFIKKETPQKGFKINTFDELLSGCPLEEKISEMHVLKKRGYSIAALAVIMIDNPLCPATGHRICNDCMKSCIYQKKDPVDIPQVETSVLTDVLKLPWGVEIYDLLTRWNPLKNTQWIMKPYNGKKVLVMGMGPAGYSLAYHLLQEGCLVIGMDGLKIESLKRDLIFNPIYKYEDITEKLSDRTMYGFGGVAEYGITSRWDKNFLKLIYISLLRRKYFNIYGGVRFGGTLHVDDVWELGFDHLAIAIGAGLPKELNIPGSLAIGMRQANDFLMSLQLTGAAKENCVTNLQVKLPAIIIGGGLTAIDTATEVSAYYISQVERVLTRIEYILKYISFNEIVKRLDKIDVETLQEIITHAYQLRCEREKANDEQREPNIVQLIKNWGGVKIIYRSKMVDSPAYKRNYEELYNSLKNGVVYLEGIEPQKVLLDDYGHVDALLGWSVDEQKHITIKAKSIFIATGTKPNVAYEFEHRNTFQKNGVDYQPYMLNDNNLEPLTVFDKNIKTPFFGPFTSYYKDNHFVSYLGDAHPLFHGSVVKAIASASKTYPHILRSIKLRQTHSDNDISDSFLNYINEQFTSKLIKLTKISEDIFEITVIAKAASKNYKPGHFYRIQCLEEFLPQIKGKKIITEPLALTPTEVDKISGVIKFIVVIKGASSRLLKYYPVGSPIIVMGPTGVKLSTPENKENVLFIVDQSNISQLIAYASELKAQGNIISCIFLINKPGYLSYKIELEKVTHNIIWLVNNIYISKIRAQDSIKIGNLLDILKNEIEQYHIDNYQSLIYFINKADRIFLIGCVDLLKSFNYARSKYLSQFLKHNPKIIASVYGPMQCMMKGICGQCLTWQIDPITQERTKAVFSCSWQDQPLEIIDINNLEERLYQNKLLEKITNIWLDCLLSDWNSIDNKSTENIKVEN